MLWLCSGPSLPLMHPGSPCPLQPSFWTVHPPIHVLQAVWMVTWVAVVALNVDLGLAVGVVFSMMTVVCRTQRCAKSCTEKR